MQVFIILSVDKKNFLYNLYLILSIFFAIEIFSAFQTSLNNILHLNLRGNILFAQQCTSHPPVTSDYNWRGVGLCSIPDKPFEIGALLSVMTENGDIYAVGNDNNDIEVAHWDGNQWTTLGDKIYRVNYNLPSVYTMDVAANGDVYIAGEFTHAINDDGTSVQTSNIARWDAALEEWVSVGQGISSFAFTLKVDNSANVVYISAFSGYNPDGQEVQLNNFGRWNINLNQWEPVSMGTDGIFENITQSSNGDVYIIGADEVYNPDGSSVNINGIGRWDGNLWHPLGSGIDGDLDAVGFQTDLNDNIYIAGGKRIFSSGIFKALNSDGTVANGPVVKWNGNNWEEIPLYGAPYGGNFGLGYPSLTIDGNNKVYILYSDSLNSIYTISRLDGNQWIKIAQFYGNNFAATLASNINLAGTNLYTGGSYVELTDPGGSALPISKDALWNGNIWSEVGKNCMSSANGTVNTLEVTGLGLSNSVLYAGGNFSEVSGVTVNNIASFDGETWNNVGNGINGVVYDIAFNRNSLASSLFVGGDFITVVNPDGGLITANNIVQWGGEMAGWIPLGRGVDGIVRAILPKVTYFNGNYYGGVVVAGDFENAVNEDGSIVQVNSIAWWNIETNQWEKIGNGITGNDKKIYAITEGFSSPYPVSEPDFFIGGSFTGAVNTDGSTVNSNNIIYWNNNTKSWESVGQGVDSLVRTLCLSSINLPGPLDEIMIVYAGGNFINSSNPDGSILSTPYISVWHPFNRTWLSIAGGLDGPVHTISPLASQVPYISKRVVIGGEFTKGLYSNGNSRFLNHAGIASLTESPNWFPLGYNAANDLVKTAIDAGWCTGAGQNIFIGGDFTEVGVPHSLNSSSSSLARWYNHYFPCYTVLKVLTNNNSSNGNISAAISPGFICSPLTFRKSNLIDEEILFENLNFLGTSVVDNLPLNQYFDLTIFPTDDPENLIKNIDSLYIESDRSGTLIFSGVDDTTLYAPNPDGHSISANVIVKNFDYENTQTGNAELIFINSVTDAPAVDIILNGDSTLVNNLAYGETSEQISIAPGNYTFDIVRNSNKQLIDSYSKNISDNSEEFILMILSGFIDPAANQNGPAISLDIVPTGAGTIITDINNKKVKEIPVNFKLYQNYPNPFNPITNIEYSIPAVETRHASSLHVTLKVFDILGREVTTLVDKIQNPGTYEITFDASELASGVYFYGLMADGLTQYKKMNVIK